MPIFEDMCEAIKANDLERLKELLTVEDLNLDIGDSISNNDLNKIYQAKLLKEIHVAIKTDGFKLLSFASEENYLAVVDLFARFPSIAKNPIVFNKFCFLWAIYNGHIDAANSLLERPQVEFAVYMIANRNLVTFIRALGSTGREDVLQKLNDINNATPATQDSYSFAFAIFTDRLHKLVKSLHEQKLNKQPKNVHFPKDGEPLVVEYKIANPHYPRKEQDNDLILENLRSLASLVHKLATGAETQHKTGRKI
jgi:hypothetical protein